MPAIILAVLPFLIKLAMWVMDTLIEKSKDNAVLKKKFIELAQSLRAAGIMSVKSRFESGNQVEAGNKAWDAKEKAEADKAKQEGTKDPAG